MLINILYGLQQKNITTDQVGLLGITSIDFAQCHAGTINALADVVGKIYRNTITGMIVESRDQMIGALISEELNGNDKLSLPLLILYTRTRRSMGNKYSSDLQS